MRKTGRILCWVILSAAIATCAAATTVQEVVDQVSQANYTDLLDNKLYGYVGDNRFLTGPQHDPCANNIFLQFRRYGWTTRFDPFAGKSEGISGPGRNVIAIKQGVTTPDNIYIVGGHYDAKKLSGGGVSPGADDNASGVAGILEAARVLSSHTFASTIVLVAFDNEEGTYSGSNPDHHGGSIHMANDYVGSLVKGMVSFDMVAWNNPSSLNTVICFTPSSSDPTKVTLQSAVGAYGSGLAWTTGAIADDSDHYPFYLKGWSAVYYAETDRNPNWHQMTDTIEQSGNIDYVYATKLTRTIVGWIATQAGMIQ